MFLGTPHRGTPFTRFGTLASGLLRLGLLDADSDIMRPLVSDSVDLDDLEKKFAKHYRNTTRVYYFETQKMHRNVLGGFPLIREFVGAQILSFLFDPPLNPPLTKQQVVPEQSATFGADSSQRRPLYTDHRGLNKFRDRNDRNYLSVSADLIEIVEQHPAVAVTAPHQPPASEPAGRGVHMLIPFERNGNFVGRESLLEQIVSKAAPQASQSRCQRLAIVGLGGVGKTQIALVAVYRIHEADPGCSIFWVPAIDVSSFGRAYREVGRKLGAAGIDQEKTDVRSVVKEALSNKNAGRWLLVVDNSDDLELLFGIRSQDDSSTDGATSSYLARCLPSSTKGSIVFTTRNYVAAKRLAGANVFAIPIMKPDEAHRLLDASDDPKMTGAAKTSGQLLGILGNLPLAIKQASAYINENQISADEYVGIYKSSEDEEIYLLSREFEDMGRYDSKDMKNPIATTWIISFRQILNTVPLAADFLRIICFLAEQDVPQSLFEGYCSSRAQVAEAIGTLKAYGFITKRDDTRSYDLHRLVQVSTRHWIRQTGEFSLWATAALETLSQAVPFPDVYETQIEREKWIQYVPHVERFLQYRKEADNGLAEGCLLESFALGLVFLGRYDEAESFLVHSINIAENKSGKRSWDAIERIDLLGNMLGVRNRVEEAARLHQQAMNLCQEATDDGYGGYDKIKHKSMGNLACDYRYLGMYEEGRWLSMGRKLGEKLIGPLYTACSTLASH